MAHRSRGSSRVCAARARVRSRDAASIAFAIAFAFDDFFFADVVRCGTGFRTWSRRVVDAPHRASRRAPSFPRAHERWRRRKVRARRDATRRFFSDRARASERRATSRTTRGAARDDDGKGFGLTDRARRRVASRRKGEQGEQGGEVREEGRQGQASEEAILRDVPQVRAREPHERRMMRSTPRARLRATMRLTVRDVPTVNRPRTLKHERKPAYPRVSVPSKCKLDRWQVRTTTDARDAGMGFRVFRRARRRARTQRPRDARRID